MNTTYKNISFQENFYYKLNNKNFLDLLNLVNSSSKWALQINSKGRKRAVKRGLVPKYQYLKDWINSTVILLQDNFYTLMTKVFWILNNITTWDDPQVQCATCHKPLKNKNVLNTYTGYFKHCSDSCGIADEKTQTKIKNTNLERLGVEYPTQSKEVQAKVRQTKLERYDDPTWNNIEKSRETRFEKYNGNFNPPDMDEKCKQTKIKNGHSPNWNNNEKAKTTRLERYNQYEPESAKEKRRQTNMEHCGFEYNFQSEETKLKSQNTCLKNYGVPFYLQSDDCKEKTIKYNMENFSVSYNSQRSTTAHARYSKYFYNGTYFDSAPELAVFIYMTEHTIPIKYHDFDGLPYMFNGNTCKYFRDFNIFLDGKWQMVEIKGAHFFKEDGTMFNPFRNKDWSDEQYKESCAKYEAKHQCMLANGVQIWLDSSEQVQTCINYVEEKYGIKYLSQFRTKTQTQLDTEIKVLVN